MLEETAQKLLVRQLHGAVLAVMSIVLPAEGHVRMVHLDKAMIRDRDAMCVARQIMKHVFRPTKGLLGIHDPVLAEEPSQESRERVRLSQWLAGSEEDELVLTTGAPQSRHELTTKDPAQNSHWQEEVAGCADPILVIRRQSAAGHYAVNVRMSL